MNVFIVFEILGFLLDLLVEDALLLPHDTTSRKAILIYLH